MSESIIAVEGLGKKYLIGHQRKERYTALRDVISNNVKGVFKKTKELLSGNLITEGDEIEEFWALDDINFNIQSGDRVGIIGRNGAGKSTLLKVLSRITEPSTGKIKINGRVASLLEVGTGFHPELTGRENIFLNGAIIGMKRSEIKRKFDEIVAFAEVEKFLDTPVKRYSSGMYVRLAFAVAAHLEPEILIVDEVLAVGDAQFQKKCMGKMEDVSKGEGRTILFVSHNMTAVKSLCKTGILLKNGRISAEGDINEVINKYQMLFAPVSEAVFDTDDPKTGNKLIRFNSIALENETVPGGFQIDQPLDIKVIFTNREILTPININLFFNAPDGTNIFATCSMIKVFGKGENILRCKIPANFLNDNIYTIDLMAVTESKAVLEVKEALTIEGVEPPRAGAWMDKFPGYIRPGFEWEILNENNR